MSIPDFHQHWYRALDGDDERLLILAPREHAKTSVVLSYVLFQLWTRPNLRVGILSQSGPLAFAFMREIARFITAPGSPFGATPVGEPWTQHELTLAGSSLGKDVSVFALGAGSQVTGRRSDLLVFDDIESTLTVGTPERRQKTREWFAKEALPVLAPGGKAVVLGTRKHFDDLYAQLLRDGSGWTRLTDHAAAFRDDGEPLWPEKWSRAALLARKAELDAVDVRAWSQEYENRPIPGDTQMFDPQAWPTYTRLPDGLRVYQGWDLAISEKTGSDFTAGITLGVDGDRNVYVLDAVRGHWPIARVQDEIGAAYDRARLNWSAPVQVAIEEAGFQSPIVRTMLAALHLPARGIKPERDKVTRARYLEARAAAATVFRPAAPVPWWGSLAQELAEFPAGAHDDQVDALAHCLHLALPIRGSLVAPVSMERQSAWR